METMKLKGRDEHGNPIWDFISTPVEKAKEEPKEIVTKKVK